MITKELTYVDEAREAMLFGWCVFVATICDAATGMPPDLTEESNGLKAQALLLDAKPSKPTKGRRNDRA